MANARIGEMQSRWRATKARFFDRTDEVKAAVFVRTDSPIPEIRETLDRRGLSQGLLAGMMRNLDLMPIGCFVDKVDSDHRLRARLIPSSPQPAAPTPLSRLFAPGLLGEPREATSTPRPPPGT